MRDHLPNQLLRVIPLLVLLSAWEILATTSSRIAFLFGRPTTTFTVLISRTFDGTLLLDAAATLIPLLSGFLIGNLTGAALGLLVWRFPRFGFLAQPYLTGLGALPAFILAPLLIVWFGTGAAMKTLIVIMSTMFIAASHTTSGARDIDRRFFQLFRSFGAGDAMIFRLLVLPSIASWVFSSLRLNAGAALLGVFMAEFISSGRGLAHRTLMDAGLYNISAVWAGALCVVAIALVLDGCITILQRAGRPPLSRSGGYHAPTYDRTVAR